MNTADLLNGILADRELHLHDPAHHLALPQFRVGALSSRAELHADAAVALRSFLNFEGEGWLCLGDHPEILSLPATKVNTVPGAWPHSGERASGNTSLHLQRAGDGWQLTWVEERAGGTATEEILTEVRFLGTRDMPPLRYAVHWHPEWIGGATAGHQELRPVHYRFLGFDHSKPS
ncbi:MAG: hypothetical protein HY735_35595 [Verrucomicrobia bacterium]|nr:hypothetical protein [Verrucomicrobiota bacterium]